MDQAIVQEKEKVVVIRFGHDWDPDCKWKLISFQCCLLLLLLCVFFVLKIAINRYVARRDFVSNFGQSEVRN